MQLFYDESAIQLRGLVDEWKGRVCKFETLTILGTTIFLASVLGPFGTYVAMPWPVRSVYWTGVLLVAIPLALLVSTVLRQQFDKPDGWRSHFSAALVFTLLFSPFLWGYTHLFIEAQTANHFDIGYFMIHAGAAALGVASLRIAISAIRTAPDEYHLTAPVREPPLLARLPETQRAPVLRLTVEDHFVDVVSANGKARLRMRFRDAVREMEPAEGFVVHRSHWVARSAIVGQRVEAGRMFLKLVDGEEVPVSRRYRQTVEMTLAS